MLVDEWMIKQGSLSWHSSGISEFLVCVHQNIKWAVTVEEGQEGHTHRSLPDDVTYFALDFLVVFVGLHLELPLLHHYVL